MEDSVKCCESCGVLPPAARSRDDDDDDDDEPAHIHHGGAVHRQSMAASIHEEQTQQEEEDILIVSELFCVLFLNLNLRITETLIEMTPLSFVLIDIASMILVVYKGFS